MKKNILLCSGGIFLVIGIYIFSPDSLWKYPLKIYRGDRIVRKIETYKQLYAKLPADLDEIKINGKESRGIFYEVLSKERYIIWFGTVLGESIQYDSNVGEWRFSAD
jgi:hypothetical protein